MKAIAVTGHPASGYAEVWAMLQLRGIARALPSRREGMSPEQVNEALCKAYDCPDPDCVTVESEFSQIEPEPFWQSMALDLMLGNINQPLWGWADPRAIFALEYWAATVPQVTFLLVYDDPQSVIHKSTGVALETHGMLLEEGGPAEMLDNWVAFNSALMKFHLRHPGRTLLAHRQQLVRTTGPGMQKLEEFLDAGRLPAPDTHALPPLHEVGDPLQTDVLAALTNGSDLLDTLSVSPNEVADAMHASQVDRYLVEAMISEKPTAMELYAELEAVADLPIGASQHKVTKGAATEAWRALIRQRSFNYQVIRRLFDRAERAKRAIADNLRGASGKATGRPRQTGSAADSCAAVSKGASRGEHHISTLNDAGAGCVRESELLLSQLHKVQEDLERYHLQAMEAEKTKQSMESALLKSREEVKALRLKIEAVSAEKKERIKHLTSVRYGKERRIAQLKARLEETRGELEALTNGPVDLSTTPGRVMLKVAAMRLFHRFISTPIFKIKGVGLKRTSKTDLDTGERSK